MLCKTKHFQDKLSDSLANIKRKDFKVVYSVIFLVALILLKIYYVWLYLPCGCTDPIPSRFSSPLYNVWGTLVIVQIFDFWFLVNLRVFGVWRIKKQKISMFECSSVCKLVRLLVCGDSIFWTDHHKTSFQL